MIINVVKLTVKEEHVEKFVELSMENVRHSVKEEGVIRFEFYQQAANPTQFMLIEAYKTEADAEAHLETEHFEEWYGRTRAMVVTGEVARYVQHQPKSGAGS